MKLPPLSATCPLCDSRFAVPAADLRGAEIVPGGEEVERVAVECPVCAWEFTADGEGRAVDNDLDREGPFEIAPDGGPDAEGLRTVTCPHCSAVHQTGEPGVTRCPRCRRLWPVEPEGEVAPEEEEQWDWEPDYEDGLEEGEVPGCPNCGMSFYEHEEYGARGGFRPLEGGRVQCPDCDWVFHPPAVAEEWLAAEGAPLPAPGFAGRDGDEDVAVYTVAADGSGDFRTIGQALAKAPWRGASVRVRPGRYEECLVLARTVELLADGPPGSVCLHSAEGPCLRIGCDTVTVRGLRLESAGVAVEVSDGRPLLEDCSIHGGLVGVVASRPRARPVLRGCRLEGGQVGALVDDHGLATLEGCVVRGTVGAGVEVLGGGRLRLTRCQVLSAGGEGLCVRRDGEAELEECVLADAACSGVSVDHGTVRLARCQVHGCGVGCCATGALLALTDCAVRDCGAAAVSVLPGGQALLRRCRLEDSPHVFSAAGLSRSLLEECELNGWGQAAVVLRGRARARLRHCRLRGPAHSAIESHHTAEVAFEVSDPTPMASTSLWAG
jgi:hypothetical protein